jgi:hypothetical protein
MKKLQVSIIYLFSCFIKKVNRIEILINKSGLQHGSMILFDHLHRKKLYGLSYDV